MVSGAHSSVPDADLARQIAGGAREAEGELCRRFAPRVRLYGLRHLGGDEAAAQDLAQHVLLLTLQKLRAGEVREPDRIDSFILGTSRLASLDFRREEARQLRLKDREESSIAVPDLEEPERPEPEQLRRCMETLSERERAVVVLSFHTGRKSAELAASLALSESNVRVIRHRAIERLRGCLETATS